MESPLSGRKTIYVDGKEIRNIGRSFSMWSTYEFDLNRTPAAIKFRALQRARGMSLYVDGERIEPEPGSEMSAEELQFVMLAPPALVILILVVYALAGP